MRRLICDHGQWSHAEQRAILEYCTSDVTGLAALFPVMAPSIDWPRAKLRGRYMVAAARMETAVGKFSYGATSYLPLRKAPFDTGRDAALVAYYAPPPSSGAFSSSGGRCR